MLLAPDIRDWVGPSHPARWGNDLVEDGLDLGLIYDTTPRSVVVLRMTPG